MIVYVIAIIGLLCTDPPTPAPILPPPPPDVYAAYMGPLRPQFLVSDLVRELKYSIQWEMLDIAIGNFYFD